MSAEPFGLVDLIQRQRSTRERPLEALSAVFELRGWLDEVEAELVDIARQPLVVDPERSLWRQEPRFSLRQIAVALGRSKSSVHRQYGDSWVTAHASIRAAQRAEL